MYVCMTASVKLRTGPSPKTVWNEQVCAHQISYRKYFFQNIWSCCAPEGLQLCIYIAVFLCGVRWRYSRATNSEPHFWSIFNYFEEGQRSQLCIDFDAVFAACQRIRCSLHRTKHFADPSVGGPTRFADLRRKFSKTQKSAAELCQIFRMVTIEIVINSTRVIGIFCR